VSPDADSFLLPAYLIRSVEQRFLELFSEGKLFGTTHTCIGQELSAVCLARHLGPDDVLFSNHRCHGHYIAATDDVEGLIAEVMGKPTGVCSGKGGSQHLCHGNFYSNGIQGGIVPVSAGIALAQKLDGGDAVTVACIGDGTLGEGVFYESLNIAAKWRLPLLVLLENNLYAQSTSQSETLAGSIADRARAFGIPVHAGSTWDYRALDATLEAVFADMRRDGGPAFLQVDTYRLAAHSKSDDDRDPAEIESYRKRDPLYAFLEGEGGNGAWRERCEEIARRVDAAVERAAAVEFSTDLAGPQSPPAERALRPAEGEAATQLAAINQALRALLESDPRVVLIGEDIRSPYGGAFKATKGLSVDFDDRVLNTPISEAAIVGIANGLALRGRKPVAEIMFGDFLTLCFDQLLNHAAKFEDMYDGQVSLPLLVRTPMGGGRGYGPTHSQSLEKHFCGIPGLDVVMLNGRTRVGAAYATLAAAGRPTLVIENKLLYAVRGDAPLPDGLALMETDEPLPTSVLQPAEPPDITIVAFGRMSQIAEEAAQRLYEDEEIVTELIFPLRVSPLDPGPIARSLRRTGRLAVVEEGTAGFDLAGEVIAALATGWREPAPFQVRRIACRPGAIPSARPLEELMMPNARRVIESCLELFNG